MSGRRSGLKGNLELERPPSATLSNSFNPPLSSQSKPPLPAINRQQNSLFTRPPSSKISNGALTTIVSTTDEADLVLPTRVFQAKKTSVNDLSQAACSYLWFRRIKEIFLVMGKQNDAFSRFDMELARTDMIQTCEQYLESERPKVGGSNLEKSEQDKLDRWKNKRLYAETFRMSYFRKDANADEKSNKTLIQAELSGGEVPNFDNAIWWYSCNEAPIYDQMNNILRLENFELLMCHRYYMSDLCQMIERSYAQNKRSQKFLVYRADKLSAADFESMEKTKEQKDAMITINGFISTSQSEKISLEYAAAKLKKPSSDVVIMYEITIDPTIPCSAYADIESISFHPRELEILFNMGSTFQIDGIENDPLNPKIKRIKLTARDFNLNLVDEMKAKVKQSSQATLSILLVRYLIELGEDRVSKRYLNQIVDSKQLENDPNLVSVYNCLGTIHSRQALYGEALDYYRKALNTQARLQFSNNNALAEIFNNIGQTHLGLNQLDEAEQNLEEGIRIQKREPKHVQQHLALLYCNLGQVAYARRDYDEAEKNFQLSYDLYNRNTKISHDALEKRLLKADLCIAFGHLKSVQNPKDLTEASAKFTEALEIYESTLPASHPKVAEARIDIVCEYARNKKFQSVIEYQDEHFLQVLKDYEIKQTTSQQDLAHLYAVIGACFAHEGKFDQAMEHWKKAVEHEQKVFLDQLLSSARVSKIDLPIRLVESAYRAAFDYYSIINDPTPEYLPIIYAKMCIYDQAIKDLRGQSSYLLANLCILQRNFKGTMVVYKRLLEIKDYDLTLTIGILLRMLTAKKNTSNDEPIEELIRIEKTLARKIADNEAIRLRMIINDCLAASYLSAKKYDEALQRSQISLELKQRHFSSNHPSLASNCQLTASCCFQRGDYKNAVQYYEKAIDIQLDNMPSGHSDICSNYFLMGDCYCLMGKIESATEFYDLAQVPIEIDAEDAKETEQDVKALIRMHSSLANIYAKQKDFTTARSHEEGKIETLKEILPAFIVKLIETEEASSLTFDHLQATLTISLGLENGKTFAQILRNFVFISSSLARGLLRADQRSENDEDATDVYQQTIELQLKLTMFEKAEEKHLAKLYEELSNAYAKLYSSMQESIQENLVKALEETTNKDHQRSLEFQIGNLHFDEKNYSEADRYWKLALEKVQNTQTIVKSIIEKLIEKNKVNLTSNDEDSDDDEDADEEASANDEETEENENNAEQLSESGRSQTRAQSVKSQRRQSTKSVSDKEKLDELAQAYLELEDYATALKYFKKHISKLEETLKDSLPDIKIQDEKIPIIKFFQSLLRQNIISTVSLSSECKEIPSKDIWSNLLQTYVKIITIAMRTSDTSDEMVKVHFAAFRTCQKLYDIPDNLTLAFDGLLNDQLDNLQWQSLLSLLSLNDSIDVLMKIAAYYTAKEAWNDALEIYRTLQDTLQNNEALQSAVNYGILKLFESHLLSDEEYRANIMTVNIRSPTIPIFDRIILCRLIVSFMREMEDETMIDTFEKELLNLQKEVPTAVDLETTDCIGHVLTKLEDDSLACLYWTELQNMYNEMLPQFIVTRLYSTEPTFEEILRAVQDMKNDLLDNILALAGSYESIASYEEKDEVPENACESLKKAIVIWSKVPSAKAKVEQAMAKVNTLQNK